MLSNVQLGPRHFTLTFQFVHIPFIQGLDECLLLYSQVAFLALVSTSFGGWGMVWGYQLNLYNGGKCSIKYQNGSKRSFVLVN